MPVRSGDQVKRLWVTHSDLAVQRGTCAIKRCCKVGLSTLNHSINIKLFGGAAVAYWIGSPGSNNYFYQWLSL